MTEAYLSALFALGLGALAVWRLARRCDARGVSDRAAVPLLMIGFPGTSVLTLFALAMLGRSGGNPAFRVWERQMNILP